MEQQTAFLFSAMLVSRLPFFSAVVPRGAQPPALFFSLLQLLDYDLTRAWGLGGNGDG